MPEKVSTRGSGAKKGAPKHQNAFAYSHNKSSKLTKKIMALPVDGLCQQCTDKIMWRKQYRKYKPLTIPKKCVSCQLKKVNKAYHVICDGCAQQKDICAKCLEPKHIVEVKNKKTSQQLQKEEQDLENKLAAMRERERRSYTRKLERGDIDPEDVPDVSASGFNYSDFDYSDDDEEEEE